VAARHFQYPVRGSSSNCRASVQLRPFTVAEPRESYRPHPVRPHGCVVLGDVVGTPLGGVGWYVSGSVIVPPIAIVAAVPSPFCR
jgi:hypothetical protein